MIAKFALVFAALSAPAFAGPVYRLVDQLDETAFNQAQQRDDTATRILSDTTIKTSGGKCLFVDALSGDSAANSTPLQVAACGATGGQGFDVISQGKHNDAVSSVLIVSTLTQACFTFDPTLTAAKQVMLYSCGGVADGSGNVTASQLFAGDVTSGPLSLAPENQPSSCFIVKGNSVEIGECDAKDAAQLFTFEGTPSGVDEKADIPVSTTATVPSPVATESAVASKIADPQQLVTVTCSPVTITESVTVTVTTSANTVTSTSSTDVTLTTTLFVIVSPTPNTNVQYHTTSTKTFPNETTSTTTVMVPVSTPSAATSSAAAAATTEAPSAKGPSDPNTIPQISINPKTTVVVS